jgi:hypothetical protein
MPISPEILPVLAIFLNAFTTPIWKKLRLLLWEPCSHAADALSLRPCVRREAVRIVIVVAPKTVQFLGATTRLSKLVKEALVPGQSLYKGVSVIA